MVNDDAVKEVVGKWLRIAHRDLVTARQGMKGDVVITETICYHCQQAAEKALKAFLVKHQVEFPKTHNLMVLINLCSDVDADFHKLDNADNLTDYAVEIRYPDDWYEPSLDDAKEAIRLAEQVYGFVEERVK